LRHAIIRVVRTSTSDVDRRQAARQPVDLACRLMVAGEMRSARVADLSASGAHLCDAPVLRVGARGTMSLDGVAGAVAFVVRDVDDRGGLHVAFEADDAVRRALEALLAGLRQRRAA